MTTPESRTATWLLLLLLSWPLFFLGLGTVPLLDPDEPYYAVPALEMLHHGSWQVPVFQGQPWFDKPILFYWIILGAYKVIGVSEFSARIGSAVGAVVGALALHGLARRLGLGSRGALVSALILATSLEYVVLARAAVTDMTLTVLLIVGMACAAKYLECERARWAGLAGMAFGLAMMTKGPVGLLIPILALATFAVFARRRVLIRPAAWAAAAIVAVAGPWYLYMAVTHLDLLVKTFLVDENLGRFLHPEHPKSSLFYLAVFGAGLLPWSGALPAAVVRAVRGAVRGSEEASGRTPRLLFALCWFAAVVAIFSLSASKLASYVLPAFPPAALLMGAFWEDWFENRRASRGAAGLAGILGVAASVGFALALSHVLEGPSWSEARRTGLLIAVAVVLGSVLALIAVMRRLFPTFLAVQTTAAIAVVLAPVYLAPPLVQASHSTAALIDQLRRLGIADQVAGTYQVDKDYSLDFYLGRSVPRVGSVSDLRSRLASAPDGIWVVHRDGLSDLSRKEGLVAETLAETPSHVAARFRARDPSRDEESR